MKIITDTSSHFTVEEAKAANVILIPLQIALNNNNYRDYLDIDSETFIASINNGTAYSSQPAAGEVMDAYELTAGEETLHITMAKGLSSTYDSACDIKNSTAADHVTVFNSQTLAGPQRYLVQLAVKMAENAQSVKETIARMQVCMQECQSFLIPIDFSFLKRGGRMTPMTATIGGFLKIKPILTQTENGERLEKFTIGRTWSGAISSVVEELVAKGIDSRHKIYVSHAMNMEVAKSAIEAIGKRIQNADIELLKLSPAMITQGGPGCVAIQYILKDKEA